MTRAGIAAVWARRRLRVVLLTMLVALPLLGGGWLWLRHSSLVAVEHVQVRGLSAAHGGQAGAIEAALDGAARGMSTLDVKAGALRAAVASYPIVRSVRARASLPHGLRIDVVEQPPVAALSVDGLRTAVAADGIVLGPGYLTGALPGLVAPRSARLAGPPASGRRVRGASLLAALAVLGAAPARLAPAVTRAYLGSKGVTLALRGGVLAYFGDATRPHAKWLSLARVLADPGSRGAIYVDVRLPERPAAGFAPGTRPQGAGAEAEASGTSDPNTAAELAAGLDAAVGGGAGAAGAGAGAGVGPGAGEAAKAAEARAGESSGEARSAGTGSGESGSAETGSSEAGSGAGAAGGSASEAGGEASGG